MYCCQLQAIALPFSAILPGFAGPPAAPPHPLTPAEIMVAVAILLVVGGAVTVWFVLNSRSIRKSPCACPSENAMLTWDGLVDRLAPSVCSKRLIVLIGTQGSGKSTLAARLAAKGFECLSADRLVEADPLLAYTAEWRGNEYYRQFKDAVRRGVNLVDDNLNITAEEQDWTVKQARKAGYKEIVLVYFAFPLELCLSHNRLRPEVGITESMIRKSWMEMNDNGIPSYSGVRLLQLKPSSTDGLFEVNDQRCACSI